MFSLTLGGGLKGMAMTITSFLQSFTGCLQKVEKCAQGPCLPLRGPSPTHAGWQASPALREMEERVWVSLASFNMCFLLAATEFLISAKCQWASGHWPSFFLSAALQLLGYCALDNEVGCHFLPQIIQYKVERQISCGTSK